MYLGVQWRAYQLELKKSDLKLAKVFYAVRKRLSQKTNLMRKPVLE